MKASTGRSASRSCSTTGWGGAKARRCLSLSIKPAWLGKEIRVFTTRPDTVYGVTFMVLAPEHPLVAEMTTPDQKAAVEDYIDEVAAQRRNRTPLDRKRKGRRFHRRLRHQPLNGEKVPIWIADYVILSYGTGAVMGVPAHDERDFAFAKKYNLPIRTVIAPRMVQGEDLEDAYVEPGTMVNSGQFDGQSSDVAWDNITNYLERKRLGQSAP